MPKGRGMPIMMNNTKGNISGMLEVRVYAIDFLRLSKISLPIRGKGESHIIVNQVGSVNGTMPNITFLNSNDNGCKVIIKK